MLPASIQLRACSVQLYHTHSTIFWQNVLCLTSVSQIFCPKCLHWSKCTFLPWILCILIKISSRLALNDPMWNKSPSVLLMTDVTRRSFCWLSSAMGASEVAMMTVSIITIISLKWLYQTCFTRQDIQMQRIFCPYAFKMDKYHVIVLILTRE